MFYQPFCLRKMFVYQPVMRTYKPKSIQIQSNQKFSETNSYVFYDLLVNKKWPYNFEWFSYGIPNATVKWFEVSSFDLISFSWCFSGVIYEYHFLVILQKSYCKCKMFTTREVYINNSKRLTDFRKLWRLTSITTTIPVDVSGVSAIHMV